MPVYGKSPIERALKEFHRLVRLEDALRRFAQRNKIVLGDSEFTKLEYRRTEDGKKEGGD